MDIKVLKNGLELGKSAAIFCAQEINRIIEEKGIARIVLSTGASQFDTINMLLEQNIDWSRVEMFHLDEYIDLSENHQASFRKYLKERFISKVNLKKSVLVNGEGNIEENMKYLKKEILESPIDLGLIGIGENAHIAFNDPPADFVTKEPYIIVDLDENCKKQQVGEGWFENIESVPKQAISMSVYQILQCKRIVSCVPNEVKARAIKEMMDNEVTNHIPATILKTHKNITLFLDESSASLLQK